MLIWSLVLFGLGILAVLDSQLNYGYLFRSANSVIFMLLSFGLLIRTRMLEKLGFKEELLKNNKELKTWIEQLTQAQSSQAKREVREEVNV